MKQFIDSQILRIKLFFCSVALKKVVIFVSFILGTASILYGIVGIISLTESEVQLCSDRYYLDEQINYDEKNTAPQPVISASSDSSLSQDMPHKQSCIEWAMITVDVSGAVEKPGVYRFSTGSRLAEAIEKAGGFSAKVDKSYVQNKLNLAQKLVDGEKIIIPFVVETKDLETLVISGIEPTSGESSSGSSNDTTSSLGVLISINDASLKELQTLTGIGEVRAQSIIDNRPYTSLKQLVEKSVITDNALSKISAQISL